MWSHVVSFTLFRHIVTRHFEYLSHCHLIDLILAPFSGRNLGFCYTSSNSLDLLYTCKLHEDLHYYKIPTCNRTLVPWPGLASFPCCREWTAQESGNEAKHSQTSSTGQRINTLFSFLWMKLSLHMLTTVLLDWACSNKKAKQISVACTPSVCILLLLLDLRLELTLD